MKRKLLKKLVCLFGMLFLTLPAWSAVPSNLLPDDSSWNQAPTVVNAENSLFEGDMIIAQGGGNGGGNGGSGGNGGDGGNGGQGGNGDCSGVGAHAQNQEQNQEQVQTQFQQQSQVQTQSQTQTQTQAKTQAKTETQSQFQTGSK